MSTQNITFRVDMSAQIAAGNFNPNNFLTVAGSFNAFDPFEYSLDPVSLNSSIYEATVQITETVGNSISYYFFLFDDNTVEYPETVVRTFLMPSSDVVLPIVFFNNIGGASAVITLKANPLLFNSSNYYLQLSTSEDFQSSISSNIGLRDNFGLVKFAINNLSYNTTYYVRALTSFGSLVSKNLSRFRTEKLGAHSFKFGFASCSWSNSTEASNAIIYDNIANKAINNELDFFIHLGDMHYRDIATNNEADFQKAFDDVFVAPRQNNCWRNLPMYYMWDDHDYGPNDTDKNNPSRQAAIAAYRRRVPSPPLAKNGAEDAPYYSFVRGRVRFIVTDIRSEREPKGTFPSTDSQQQVFSADQKQWFFNEMLSAKNSGQIIVWANTKPWVSSIQDGKDDWGGYHAARLEIVDFINQHELANKIVIISGDMHALAYDDGSSSNNFGNLKVCHAAALDQFGSSKGGPYTLGPIRVPSTGNVSQYGIIEINDNGNEFVNIRFRGISVNRSTGVESPVIDVNFNLDSGTVLP